MIKLIKHYLINYFYLISFILLSSIFVSENVFSRNHWERKFAKITYNIFENSITISFIVINYNFNVIPFQYQHAYLSDCDFYFTTDGVTYKRLMRAECKDQKDTGITKLIMKYKHPGMDLEFIGVPKNRRVTKWGKDGKDVLIQMENRCDLLDIKSNFGVMIVRWNLDDKYKKVKRIRLNGVWIVAGFGHDDINNEYYDLSSSIVSNTHKNLLENNRIKVASKEEMIVIKGAEKGENIKVYNSFGVEVQSTITNSDVVNIKLPNNQIYFVTVGQSRYKVAL